MPEPDDFPSLLVGDRELVGREAYDPIEAERWTLGIFASRSPCVLEPSIPDACVSDACIFNTCISNTCVRNLIMECS